MISELIYYAKPLIEISILWFIMYQILLFFEGTRAIFVVRGVIILLVSFFVFQRLQFLVLDWLMTKLFGISIIAILVIFHPEIRLGLAHLGKRHLFAPVLQEVELDRMLNHIATAAEHLAREKQGALIAIAQHDPLTSYTESGVSLDAKVSSELLQSIFSPSSLLHDGGVVVQHGRIAAAGCIFPLTQKQELNRVYGTRHRAALGLSEETDALVLVVSEERQDFSLIYEGKIMKDISRADFIARGKTLMQAKKSHG